MCLCVCVVVRVSIVCSLLCCQEQFLSQEERDEVARVVDGTAKKQTLIHAKGLLCVFLFVCAYIDVYP